MRVAAVQFKADKHDKPASLARLAALARRAAAGSDLVVLPEMAATQYLWDADSIASVAEPPDGATFRALSPVAKEAGCWLVAGFPERAGDRYFNAAMVLDPAGERRFVYRKTLLYDADVPWATPGDSGYRSFDTDAGRFTLGICMDLNDDRFVAWCAASGAEAIAFPTNWIEENLDTWSYWAWRLVGSPGAAVVTPVVGAALVAANTYGPEASTVFSGRSAVMRANVVLAAAPQLGDAVIRASLGRSSTPA